MLARLRLAFGGEMSMRQLTNGSRREILAILYLDLNTGLSNPWRALGIKNRVARDLVAIGSIIIRNHQQNKSTSRQEIEATLGLARNTVQRRLDLLKQHGFLAGEGTGYWLSDATAKTPLLSSTQLADIEASVHRASQALRAMNDDG